MFITLEGPEGSGKTSQLKLLQARLRTDGHDVLVTREPGGTLIGDDIRDCVHNVRNTGMSAETEMLLYSASRAQHVHELIAPALAKGAIVLCDRFYDSTLAYQGYGRGLDLAALQQVTDFATGGLKPDLTILLDIDVERGLRRRVEGDLEMNRLDLEAVDFHKRVRAGYHALVTAEPGRWLIVDADRPVADIQAELVKLVLPRIRARAQETA